MNKPRILLFDSGMGGLTIYQAIRESLANAQYLYCFDNAYFPYSERSPALLIERALKIVNAIHQQFPLDMLVVACNTASTVVLPDLRAEFQFPVVGTVPAIKPAAEISQSKTIGLLATKGTIQRPYVQKLIEKYAADCIVEKIGSTELPEIVEEKQRTGKVDIARLQKIIAPWQQHPSLDTLILGCTHFPLVKEELQQLLPNVPFFVDPNNGIANRVQSLLSPEQLQAPPSSAPNLAFCTKASADFLIQQQIMQKWGFQQLQVLEL